MPTHPRSHPWSQFYVIFIRCTACTTRCARAAPTSSCRRRPCWTTPTCGTASSTGPTSTASTTGHGCSRRSRWIRDGGRSFSRVIFRVTLPDTCSKLIQKLCHFLCPKNLAKSCPDRQDFCLGITLLNSLDALETREGTALLKVRFLKKAESVLEADSWLVIKYSLFLLNGPPAHYTRRYRR